MAKISGLRVEEETTETSLPTLLSQHFLVPWGAEGQRTDPCLGAGSSHQQSQARCRAQLDWDYFGPGCWL